MNTLTIVLQTDLDKEALYEELVSLKNRLKMRAFHIEGFDVEESK